MVCDIVNKGLGGHTFSISSYFDSSAGMGGEERNKNKNKNKTKTSNCCSLLWEKELINAKGKQLEKRPLQGGLKSLTEAVTWIIRVEDFKGIFCKALK